MTKTSRVVQSKKSSSVPKKGKEVSRAPQPVQMAPVAMSSKNKTRNADVNYAKDGKSCVVIHRERFATILGSTGFATNSFVINPGQSATFPWLSGIANRFESYSFDSLDFEFKTKTATTALGDVILAVDYDATDAAPTDSIQAEAYDESASGAPWQNVTHRCKRMNLKKLPMFFVRGDTQPASTDLKLSDMGNLFVCTENQADTALVGYMYVSYKVRLYTPQLRSNDISISGGVATGATSMTAANPFGTAGSFDSGARGVSISGSTFTFTNPGTYVLSLIFAGTGISAVSRVDSAGLVSSSISGIANGAGTTFINVVTLVSTVANATLSISLTATTVTLALNYVGSAPYGALALFTKSRPCQVVRHDNEEDVVQMMLSGENFSGRAHCVRRMIARNDGVDIPCPSGCWCSTLRYAPGTGVNQCTGGKAL